MKSYQTEAIVLAVRDWRGADKMVTLFTRDVGKVTAAAYGLRQPRNHLAGSVQLFSQIDAALSPGKNVDTLRFCELIESNRVLREDLQKMAYAALVSEVVAELWPEREAQPEVFETVCAAMTLLAQRNPRIAALAACWQLAVLAGYHPELDHCVRCGGNDQAALTAFDPEAGGLVCSSCCQPSHLLFADASRSLLQRLLALDLAEPERFTAMALAVAQTETVLLCFLEQRLDKPLQSLSFIRSLSALE